LTLEWQMMSAVRKKKSSIAMPSSVALNQVVLWIGANAGGVSKTTLAIHIGYEIASRGFDVAILDLDTNVSMNQFCGLSKSPRPEETIATVFSEDFSGEWPLITPEWGVPKGKLQICQGGPVMVQVGLDLGQRNRREYVLADALDDHPLPHQLIILDCPATLGNLNDVALAVSTHLIIPVELTPKSLTGSDALLTWYRMTCKKLRLSPTPMILGFIPTQFNSGESMQRDLLEQLPKMIEPQQLSCYPPIRYTCEFINASARGVPLFIHRGSHKACADFLPICDDLTQLIKGNPSG
jgi:chromosome partitioning protein